MMIDHRKYAFSPTELFEVIFSELPLVLVVVILLFGAKKIPSSACDLGTARRDFLRALSSESKGKREGNGTNGTRSPRKKAA